MRSTAPCARACLPVGDLLDLVLNSARSLSSDWDSSYLEVIQNGFAQLLFEAPEQTRDFRSLWTYVAQSTRTDLHWRLARNACFAFLYLVADRPTRRALFEYACDFAGCYATRYLDVVRWAPSFVALVAALNRFDDSLEAEIALRSLLRTTLRELASSARETPRAEDELRFATGDAAGIDEVALDLRSNLRCLWIALLQRDSPVAALNGLLLVEVFSHRRPAATEIGALELATPGFFERFSLEQVEALLDRWEPLPAARVRPWGARLRSKRGGSSLMLQHLISQQFHRFERFWAEPMTFRDRLGIAERLGFERTALARAVLAATGRRIALLLSRRAPTLDLAPLMQALAALEAATRDRAAWSLARSAVQRSLDRCVQDAPEARALLQNESPEGYPSEFLLTEPIAAIAPLLCGYATIANGASLAERVLDDTLDQPLGERFSLDMGGEVVLAEFADLELESLLPLSGFPSIALLDDRHARATRPRHG